MLSNALCRGGCCAGSYPIRRRASSSAAPTQKRGSHAGTSFASRHELVLAMFMIWSHSKDDTHSTAIPACAARTERIRPGRGSRGTWQSRQATLRHADHHTIDSGLRILYVFVPTLG